MKKVLAILFLLSTLPAFSTDDFGIQVPEWKDFAPSAFVNIEKPKKINKFNLVADYWYKRRMDFEAGLDECLKFTRNDERFNCYEELKVKQYRENSEYNARIEARQNNSSKGVYGMESMQDTMLPINNYVNSFTKMQANEF